MVRQFSSALNWHTSHSRQLSAVPRFVKAASARLSDYTYTLIRKELDILHDDMPQAECEKINGREWQVVTNYREYKCNSELWTYSRLFFSSVRLPCRHIMLVTRTGLRLRCLPDEAVNSRWCMRAARRLDPAYKDSCTAISTVLDLVRLQPRDTSVSSVGASLISSAPGSEVGSTQLQFQDGEGSDAPQQKQKISYMRLRRGDQADMVVLSSNEK